MRRSLARRCALTILPLILGLLALGAGSAMTMTVEAGCETRSCERRVAARERAEARRACDSRSCKRRVGRKARVRREKAEMRRYRAAPLPWCTWGPESGPGDPWARARYRIPNMAGGDGGGKFQIMLATWANFGGRRYGVSNPIYARPVLQERVARRIAADGLHHWVNC